MSHPNPCIILLAWAVASAAYADPWTTDYEKAVEVAKEENKLLLLNFSGSDWCHWCMKLDEEVFSEKEFEKFAENTLVCVLLDSPRGIRRSSKRSADIASMKSRFQVRGFPTIILVDADEEEIGRLGYKPGGAEPYVERLREMMGPHMDLEAAENEIAAETSKYRTWTSKSGSTISAELVENSGGWIKLRKEDGAMLRIEVESLSKSDREFIGSR
jgi:protein disulfide-isomerase